MPQTLPGEASGPDWFCPVVVFVPGQKHPVAQVEMIIFPLERVWKPHGLDWFFLSRWILSVFVPGQKPGSQQVFHTIPIPSLDKGTAD